MRADRFINLDDARTAAKRVLPHVVFDYIDGAADDEHTMRANREAFFDYALVPRMARGSVHPDVSTDLAGCDLSLPVLLAPCGLVRAMHPAGGPGVARAAKNQGTVSVLSTVAGNAVEEVCAAAPGSVWFQLYAAGGRDEAENLVSRAQAAGAQALVVTVDTPVLGNRERDRRHGVTPPLRLSGRNALHLGAQVLARPAWTARAIKDGVKIARARRSGGRPATTRAGAVAMGASPFSWEDVSWLRSRWQRPLLVKGVLSSDDALRAVDAGADGVIVSNHGGRQLDRTPGTLGVLPEIVAAVRQQDPSAAVLVDGGIRRGSDVVIAIALGARAVLVGRPFLYALSAAGQAGVEKVLSILHDEMVRTMALLGAASLSDLDLSWVRRQPTP